MSPRAGRNWAAVVGRQEDELELLSVHREGALLTVAAPLRVESLVNERRHEWEGKGSGPKRVFGVVGDADQRSRDSADLV